MGILHLVLVLVLLVSCAHPKTLPSYVQTCKRSDPNFVQCFEESANKIIPIICEGDKVMQVPNMNPLILPEVKLSATSTLDLQLRQITLWGLRDARVHNVTYDLEKMHVDIPIHLGRIELNADYKVNGQILILPITGAGRMNLTLSKASAMYNLDYDLVTRHKKEYMHLTKSSISIALEKDTEAFLELTNLFGGNKQLGEEMRKFLVENSHEVAKEMQSPVSQTINAVIISILHQFFERIPYNDILPID